MNRVQSIAVFILTILGVAYTHAQMDSTAGGASLSAPSNNEVSSSGTLAIFTGFQQGVHTEQGEETKGAEWLVGAAPNLPLGGPWELSPVLVLWHLTSDAIVVVDPPHPTGGRAIGEKWKWYMKLGLPVRWFPLTDGRFSAYALGGPACLLWKGAIVTLDVGAGIHWELSRLVALTGEARTHLYYHTSEQVVLASRVSLILGIRLRQAR